MPLTGLTAEGSLSIDGVDMANQFGAWGILHDGRGEGGLLKLWSPDFVIRGENRILPSVTGVLMYEHRMTETTVKLNLCVVGDVDGQTGLANTDATEGMEVNFDYLYENVVRPPGNSTGTRTGVLTLPSGATRTAEIQVLRTETQNYLLRGCDSLWISSLFVRIPGGRFIDEDSS